MEPIETHSDRKMFRPTRARKQRQASMIALFCCSFTSPACHFAVAAQNPHTHMYCTTCSDATQHLLNCACQVVSQKSDTHRQCQPEVLAVLGHCHLVAVLAFLCNGIQASGSISLQCSGKCQTACAARMKHAIYV